MSYDPGSKLHKLWKQQQKKTKLLISLSVMGLLLFIGVASAFPLGDLVLSLLFPKPLSLAALRFGNSEVSPYPLDLGIVSKSQPAITKELIVKNLGSTPSALPTPDWGYSHKEGRALSFNGQDSYVDLGTPQVLDALLVSDFTISLWINPTLKANQNSVILARGDSFSSQQNKFILIYLDQGKLTASLRGDQGEKNSTSISSPTTIPANTWTHITLIRKRATSLGMVKKTPLSKTPLSPKGAVLSATTSASPSATLGTGPSATTSPSPSVSPSPTPPPTASPTPSPSPTTELVLYINGREEGRVKDDSGAITFVREKGARPLSLGSAFLGSSQNTPSYQGLMDDLLIFKKALSLEEITNLSSASSPTTLTNQTNLLGYWKFDEGKGETLNDASSFGNQGQIKGSASFLDGRITIPTPIAFNSTSNNTSPYLKMDSHPALDQMLKNSFTISGWAKYQGSGNKILIGRGDTYAGEQNKFILLYLGEEGKLVASLRGDNGEKNTTSVFGKTPIQAGEWFHYSLVRQKNVSLTLYLNGLADSDPILDQAGDLTFTKDRPLTLGAANVGSGAGATSSLFQGLMDDIRVYNLAFTLNQIRDLNQEKVALSNQPSYPKSSNLPHPKPLPPTPSSYTLSLKTPTLGYTLESSPSAFTLPPTQSQTATLTLKIDLNTLKEGSYSNELILNIDQTNYSIPLSFNYSIPILNKLGIGGKAKETQPLSIPSTSLLPTTTDTSHNMGVLVIKYFPLTSDGRWINQTVTGEPPQLFSSIRQRIIDSTITLKEALERSSRYLGYRNSAVPPALSYRIIDTNEHLQAMPISTTSARPRTPDYYKIMTDHRICDYVENRGVNEVWIWAYQGPNQADGYPFLGISESKMAGPFGDISNSYRENNMPICRKTYRVYTFNYFRDTAMALESWGHQMEVELDVVDRSFFREKFQGPAYPQSNRLVGRCGSVHNSPNARYEYDRSNTTPQLSDCWDWNPDSNPTTLGSPGGAILSPISCENWSVGCQDRGDADNPVLNYMIWNWQNLPGRNNLKTYQGKKLRNWWDIHGDFDGVMGGSRSIFLPPGTLSFPLSLKLQGIGSGRGENSNPLRRDRVTTVKVLDSDRRQVASSAATLEFDGNNFVGRAYLGSIGVGSTSPSYYLTAKVDNSLSKLLSTSPISTTSGTPIAESSLAGKNDWILAGTGSSKVAAVTDNDDASYIWRGAIWGGEPNPHYQWFVLSDLVITSTIQSIEVHYMARASLGGNSDNQIKINIANSSGTFRQGSTRSLTNNTYQEFTDTFTTNPSGGFWTMADVNDLQIGVENAGAGGDQRQITKIWAVVNYNPSSTLIMGDVNNDNVINISDFTVLRSCFSSRITSPNWNTCQASDFNDDGRISVTDYSRLITNFGRRGE